MDDEKKLEEYPVYVDCNTCEHQNEVCTDCMSRNAAGEWVHSKYKMVMNTSRVVIVRSGERLSMGGDVNFLNPCTEISKS